MNCDSVYNERNRLVALLATIYPSGLAKTAIDNWDESWHNCVYIDFPWGQASWHFHDNELYLFEKLPVYEKNWDGHTTEEKYDAIQKQVNLHLTKTSTSPIFKSYRNNSNNGANENGR
jgi:hypothetical protein